MTTNCIPAASAASTPLFAQCPTPVRVVRPPNWFTLADFEPVGFSSTGLSCGVSLARLVHMGLQAWDDDQLLAIVEHQANLVPKDRELLAGWRQYWLVSGRSWQSPGGREVARCIDFDVRAGEWRRGLVFLDDRDKLSGVTMAVLCRRNFRFANAHHPDPWWTQTR